MLLKKESRFRKIIKYKDLYLLLLPGLIWVLLFRYLPLYGITIAFKDFHPLKGVFGSEWVGLKYFVELINSPYFFRVVRNTILLNIYHIIFGFPAPIILALLLNELRNYKFKKFVQSTTYLPHFISWVIIGSMVIDFLSPNYGLVNEIRKMVGLEPIFYLIKNEYFRSIVVLSNIWKTTGWAAIIYLASLSNVNLSLYESAMIDGANRWQQTWHITLPAIKPTILILFILRFGQMMNASFEQIYMLYSSAVYEVGDVIPTYVYRIGIGQARFSETAALDLINSVIAFVLITTMNYLSKKYGENSLW